ncbi:MAG: hypothetical protein RLZZ26_373 [Candidatus Parcubacteria bacterium]|jgi:hypothetical protein
MTETFVLLGCIFGNYAYQAFGGRDWSVALERSFYQAIPIACLLLIRALPN